MLQLKAMEKDHAKGRERFFVEELIRSLYSLLEPIYTTHQKLMGELMQLFSLSRSGWASENLAKIFQVMVRKFPIPSDIN